MILCRLRFVTPGAEKLQVVVFVGAAVLKGNPVVDVPIVSRLELAPATGTLSAGRFKDPQSPQWRHAAARGVGE